ncbi:MAG TPA: ComEC/Rec2 family competence protein [Acidimicrobiia bacterium]
MLAGPLALLGALVAGILAGERLGPSSAWMTLVVGLLAAAIALFSRSPVRVLIAMLACALIGTAVMRRALDGQAHSPLGVVVDARATGVVRATLIDDPGGASRFTTRVLVRVAAVGFGPRAGTDAGGRVLLASASGDVAGRLRLLEAGDDVVLRGWFHPLTGFDVRSRWRHAVGAFGATELLGFVPARSPLAVAANRLRALVLHGGDRLPPAERALMAGFLLGDTRQVPPQVITDFRDAGLSHLLAVSGENVAFVLLLASWVLRRFALRGRFIGALVVIVLFGAMTRWEPSVLRASVMIGCAMTARFVGRPTSGLRALTLAVLALLFLDPFLLHSVGFLLSCGASAGIALFSEPIARRLPGPWWLGESLGVTTAAQLGVAPVLIPVFGSMPLAALPANVLAAPLVGPLTIWGLLAGVVGGVAGRWSPALATLLELPSRALLDAVMGIAHAMAQLPVAVDGRAAWALIALAALAAAAHRLRASYSLRSGQSFRPPRSKTHPRSSDGSEE